MMTNLEHYLKNILDINYNIAVSKKTGKLEHCNDLTSDLSCDDCRFYDDEHEACATCNSKILSWMFEEYKPPISNLEYDILDYLYNNTKFRYIARDEAEWLYAYYEAPVKGTDCWEGGECYGTLELFGNLFKFVKWEDAKPTSIKEILDKREVMGDGNY